MDSMHPLSTSLPPTRKRLDQPELLADFKAAALSVTNLYKSAAASQDRARAAGYQDAVEDLLSFLDRENLGLMDGEGWRVRQWATQQLPDDGIQRTQQEDENEVDEAGRRESNARSSSPETQRKPQPPNIPMSSSELQESPHRRVVSEPPPTYPSSPAQPPTREDFSFRSSYSYPTNHERESNGGMDLDNSSAPTTPNPDTNTSVRIIPRSARSRHHRRANAANTVNVNLGAGAGSKRKLPYPDFFDISGFNFEGHDRRDGGGGGGGKGGKRGRHV